MKPERALAVMQQRKAVEEANRRLKATLDQKESAPPKFFEYNTPRQRYLGLQKMVLAMIRNPHPYGTPHVQGATPNIPILVSSGGEEVSLRLKFEAGDDETESTLAAVWTSGDKTLKLPPHREEISEDLAVQSRVSRAEYATSFDNFEWSLAQYLEAVAQMAPDQLSRFRFPKDFRQKVQTFQAHS